MKKISLIICTFIIYSFNLIAQNNILLVSGIIYDKETKEPIPFAGVNIEGTALGTIANIDGEFELKVNSKYEDRNLLFTCLGYEITKCEISERLRIALTPDKYILDEIVVKPLNPLEVLKEAIAKIPDNYSNKPIYLDAFYRNLFMEDTTYINLVEAACVFHYAPYHQDYDILKAQKAYYANRRLGNCDWFNGINNYFDLYTAPNDQVKVIESRISEYNLKSFNEEFVVGGPLNLIASDKVKYLNDFMDEKHFRHYKYKIDGRTMFNGHEVIIISFSPKRIQFRNHNPGWAKYVNRKNYYNAEFKGKIYVDYQTKAFIRIAYDLIKVRAGQRMQPLVRSIQTDYKEYNGKWYLGQINRKRIDKGYNNSHIIDSVTVEEQLIVNGIRSNRVSKFANNEIFPHSNYMSLNRYPMGYNKDFWQNLNLLTHNKLNNKATRDLQMQKPLIKQFEDMQVANDSMPTPIAAIRKYEYNLHDKAIIDNYKWLENKDSSEVIQYLKDENRFTYNYFLPHRSLQNKLQNEMIGKMPARSSKQIYNKRTNGNFVYFDKYGAYDENPIIYRKNLTTNVDELVFDLKTLAKKHGNFYLFDTYLSHDNKHIAFNLDTIGNEHYTCLIFDIEKKSFSPEIISNIWGLVWAKDSKSFYYVLQDSLNRPSSVYHHKLGNNVKNDKIIYHENDAMCDVDVWESELKNYIFMSIGNFDESELRYLDLNKPTEGFNVFYRKEKGHNYQVKESENEFYILSNHKAINNGLYRTAKNKTDIKYWVEVVEPRKDTLLKSFYVGNNYMVLNEVYNVQSNVRVVNKETKLSSAIRFNDQ